MAKIYAGAGTKIARIAGKSSVMDQAAAKVQARATALAARNRETGAYSNNFKVAVAPGKSGVSDRVVYNDHPAALAIELGHFAERRDGTKGRFVPGKFNLHAATRGV